MSKLCLRCLARTAKTSLPLLIEKILKGQRCRFLIRDLGQYDSHSCVCVCMKHEEIILWYCLTGIIGHQHVPRNLLRTFNQYSHVNHTFSVIHHCEAVLSQDLQCNPRWRLHVHLPNIKHISRNTNWSMFVGDFVILPHDSRCFFSRFFWMDVPFTGMTCPLQGKDSQTRGHGQESSKKSKNCLIYIGWWYPWYSNHSLGWDDLIISSHGLVMPHYRLVISPNQSLPKDNSTIFNFHLVEISKQTAKFVEKFKSFK